MTAGISSIPGKPALIEGVNELEGERLNSPPKLGGEPARPSSSTKGRAGGVVPTQVVARFYLGTTPSAPALVASRPFLRNRLFVGIGNKLETKLFCFASQTLHGALLELLLIPLLAD